jgi:hypothetical protein
LVLALVGCGRGGADRNTRMPVVATAPVEPVVFSQGIDAIATLEAAQSVQLASQVSGRVLQLLTRQGQSVRPGQVLLVLDQTQLQAEVASLRAQMQTDRLNYERYERLVREGAASAIQRDQFRQTAMASRACPSPAWSATAISWPKSNSPPTWLPGSGRDCRWCCRLRMVRVLRSKPASLLSNPRWLRQPSC